VQGRCSAEKRMPPPLRPMLYPRLEFLVRCTIWQKGRSRNVREPITHTVPYGTEPICDAFPRIFVPGRLLQTTAYAKPWTLHNQPLEVAT
jgi:hypothetical protein